MVVIDALLRTASITALRPIAAKPQAPHKNLPRQSQIGEGDSYLDLRPSIGICILDAILFRDVPDLHLDFRLVNQSHSLLLTDCLPIHLLKLPKYRSLEDDREITAPIAQWAFFFRRASELTPDELIARLQPPSPKAKQGAKQGAGNRVKPWGASDCWSSSSDCQKLCRKYLKQFRRRNWRRLNLTFSNPAEQPRSFGEAVVSDGESEIEIDGGLQRPDSKIEAGQESIKIGVT